MAGSRNGNPARLEKDFGPYPWGNSVVKAACEDQDGNLIVGTLGAGVFWYEADGKCRHISTEQGLSSAVCPFPVHGSRGKSLGGNRRRRLGPDQKKNLSTRRRNCIRGRRNPLSEDAHGGLWAAFNAHGRVVLDRPIPRKISHVGQASNAWTVLVDHEQQVWAGTLDEGLFQFQTNHFQPAPGAEILGPQIFALFEDRDGQLWAGTQNGLANLDGQNWKLFTTRDGLSENTVRAIAEDAGGNLWVGTESRRLESFQGRKIHFLSANRKMDCPATTFPAFTRTRTASCGSAPPATAWRGFKTENGRVIPRDERSRQQQHQLHHRRRRRAICGSAPTPG